MPSPFDPTGEFAEAVRDQFMKEREEYFRALEQALLDATLQAPDCTVAQLAAALQRMDPDMTEAQVQPCSALRTFCGRQMAMHKRSMRQPPPKCFTCWQRD